MNTNDDDGEIFRRNGLFSVASKQHALVVVITLCGVYWLQLAVDVLIVLRIEAFQRQIEVIGKFGPKITLANFDWLRGLTCR